MPKTTTTTTVEKTTPATEPTIIAPVLAPVYEETTTVEDETIPEVIVSRLPDGVEMVAAGKLPRTADRAVRIEPDRKAPPPGWQGSFTSCGSCGDFLGNSSHCPKCSPLKGDR